MKRIAAWIGIAMLVVAPAIAQTPTESIPDKRLQAGSVAKPLTGERTKDFGTSNFYSALDSSAMVPYSRDFLAGRSAAQGLTCGGASTESRAIGQVLIPHGVDIELIRVWGSDSSATDNLQVTLESSCLPDFTAAIPTATTLGTVVSSGSSGAFTDGAVVAGTVLADNQSCTYRVIVRFGDTNAACDTALVFYKARIQWDRLIPLAPAQASFTDVPTNAQFFREIEALADTGITAGCTATEFCPDEFVTRRQMAAFLARALGLQPPSIPDPANP